MSRHRKVRSIMKTDVATVSPEAVFKAVAILLASWGISGAPVVNRDGVVVGVVSQGDLLDRGVGRRRRGRLRGRSGRRPSATTAAGLMTAPAVTIGPDADVTEAARLMEERRIHRLPVVDDDRKLIGLVGRSELLRVFLRPDDEIRTEVREEVIEREMCVDPRTVEVAVHQGVVVLRGELERKALIPILVALVRRVDGVVDVEARLTAKKDDTPVNPANAGVPGW